MKAKNKKINSNLTKELKGKIVLITGGAGSLGSAITKKLLDYPVKIIRILDIDEYRLFKLKKEINDGRLRFLLGSILDKDRLSFAGAGVDLIIHTAAIKNIEISEFNPIETIDVNINGTVNLIKMAMYNSPKIFLNISTDKATDPSTLYGSTKQLSERLTTWAGHHLKSTKFATVRLGNIFETRGNVFETWKEEKEKNQPISITDSNMERFFLHLDEAVSFVLECIPNMNNGEIFVPNIKLYNIQHLANKVSKKQKIVGLRKGEKLVEILISDSEKKHAIKKDNMWIITEK
tara:strand:+ start:639 stop:1511 length:873 start_codon:yes stop_codon:yes gene_type:complete